MDQEPETEIPSAKRPGRAIALAIGFIVIAYLVSIILFPRRMPFSGEFTLPDRMVAILNDSTRVETFRVAPEEENKDPANEILGYPIIAKGKEQGQEFAKRLAKTMVGGGVTQNRKKCGLRPGIAFRAWSGNDAVEIVICFECNVLWPHIVGEPNTQSSEWQDFDPVKSEFVKLAKEAFPDDQAIQSLSTWW